jgi:hypothetical protein
VVAPPSRHVSGLAYEFVPGRDLDAPLAEVPAPLRERLQQRVLDRPAAPLIHLPLTDGPAHPYARAALAEELSRVAAAPVGERNRRLWEAGRNLYNLVAGGALQERQVHQRLLDAAEAADAAFRQANPDRAHIANHPDPLTRHHLVRAMEDVEVRGYRVWTQEARENWSTAPEERQAVLRQRAAAAQLTTQQAERAFDRLNPDFGVPADTSDPLGQQAVRDREAALSLGPRVAVAASRENDRDPVIWLAGQDYRAADAIRRARSQPVRTRQPVERAGAER